VNAPDRVVARGALAEREPRLAAGVLEGPPELLDQRLVDLSRDQLLAPIVREQGIEGLRLAVERPRERAPLARLARGPRRRRLVVAPAPGERDQRRGQDG
jgi:hypothetical protein